MTTAQARTAGRTVLVTTAVITVIVIVICLRRTFEGQATSALSLVLPVLTLLVVARIGARCLRHGQKERVVEHAPREPEARTRPSLFPPGGKQI